MLAWQKKIPRSGLVSASSLQPADHRTRRENSKAGSGRPYTTWKNLQNLRKRLDQTILKLKLTTVAGCIRKANMHLHDTSRPLRISTKTATMTVVMKRISIYCRGTTTHLITFFFVTIYCKTPIWSLRCQIHHQKLKQELKRLVSVCPFQMLYRNGRHFSTRWGRSLSAYGHQIMFIAML